jgi:hypothetical protein
MKTRVWRFGVTLGIVALMSGAGAGVASADPGGVPNQNAQGVGECGPPGHFIRLIAQGPGHPDVPGREVRACAHGEPPV